MYEKKDVCSWKEFVLKTRFLHTGCEQLVLEKNWELG